MPIHPTTFISYSWDDEDHKAWVRELATQLRADGVDARLDHWHAVPGDELPEFMEREIRNNDFVLIICTPKYKAKSDNRAGGVGYEGDIMIGEIFVKHNHRNSSRFLLGAPGDQTLTLKAERLSASRESTLVLPIVHPDLADAPNTPQTLRQLAIKQGPRWRAPGQPH